MDNVELTNLAGFANEEQDNQQESYRREEPVYQAPKGARTPIFSFSNGGTLGTLFTQNGGNHSEYLNTIKNDAEKIIAAHNADVESTNEAPLNLKLLIIDRKRNNDNQSRGRAGLSAPTIVVSHKLGDEIYYYWFLFSHLGKDVATTNEMNETYKHNEEILESGGRRSFKDQLLYNTADSIVDELFHDIVQARLREQYKLGREEGEFVSLQGMIFSPNAKNYEPAELAETIACVSYNTMVSYIGIYNREAGEHISEINIAKDIMPFRADYNFKMDLSFNPVNNETQFTDKACNIIRQDFVVNTYAETKQQTYQSHNSGDDTEQLCYVAGYVDAIPYNHIIPGRYNEREVVLPRLHPHVIITQAEGRVNTLGFKLLSIATATHMLKKENYLMSIYNNIGTKSDPGYLNLITNLREDKQGDVKYIDFTSGNNQFDIQDQLTEMFCGDPIMSIDLIPYTDQSAVDVTLITAASAGSTTEREWRDASQDIINTAVTLTNGEFPSNFPLDRIFAQPALSFPAGYFPVKSDIKDLRNIDLACFLGSLKEKDRVDEIIGSYLTTNYPEVVNDSDPYFTRIKLINNVLGIKNGVVVSTGTRLTFHPEFVEALVSSIARTDFSPYFQSNGLIAREKFSLDAYSRYTSHSGIRNVNFGSRYQFGNGSRRSSLFQTTMRR